MLAGRASAKSLRTLSSPPSRWMSLSRSGLTTTPRVWPPTVPARAPTLKYPPGWVSTTRYTPGRSPSKRYWPVASVDVVRPVDTYPVPCHSSRVSWTPGMPGSPASCTLLALKSSNTVPASVIGSGTCVSEANAPAVSTGWGSSPGGT